MASVPLITKAIIPAAGLGTRFLPATKAQPKEMLPIVDKPVIQYVVEEAVASGITDIILITGAHKRALEDHFDRNFELEWHLDRDKKFELLEEIQRINTLANFYYVRQKMQLGDGHALLCARSLIGNEPCAVLFGDDVIDAKRPVLAQLIDVYARYQDPVMAVVRVPKSDVGMYGIVEGKEIAPGVWQVHKLIEKPKPGETNSRLANVGRYVLTPEALDATARARPSHHGELRLIDGFRELLKTRSLYAVEFTGNRYDCGNKLQFVKATVAMGLKHPEVRAGLRAYLRTLK